MENLLNNSRKYLLSVIIDNFGSSITTFILPLLVISTSNSVLNLSIISSLSVIPFLILGLPFGALIDRLNIKKILYISDLIRFIAFILMAGFIFYIKKAEILMIAIFLFSILTSCVNVMSTIAEATYTPKLVLNEQGLSRLNSTIYGIQYVVGVASPIIGGIIYGKVNTYYIFIFSSVCFLISSLILLSLTTEDYKINKLKEDSLSNILNAILNDIIIGYKNIRGNKEVFYPLVIVAFFNILTANFYNDSLIIMKKINEFSTTEIGLVTSIASLGALLGASVVGILSKKISFYKLLFFNMAIQLGLRFIFFMVGNLILVTATIFMIDMFQSILNIIIITNRQKNIEEKYLGRANSIYKTVLIGVNTFGFLIGGAISKSVGSKKGLLLSCLGIILLILFSSILVKKNSVNS